MLCPHQMHAETQSISLAQNTLHVWTTSINDEVRPLSDETLAVLSDDELARAGRLHNLDARLLFTRAHIALRQTLSRYALIPAQDWSFEIGQYGRPEISNLNAPKGLRFNLSHTPGMIAIIIHCSFNAGLDVEGIGRVVDHSAMSRICFSAAERDALLALPVEEQPLRFAQTWALKESLVKAMGTGLTTPLKSFSFDLSVPDAIGFNCSSDIDKNPSAWSFSLNRPTDYHVLATATRIESNETVTMEHFPFDCLGRT